MLKKADYEFDSATNSWHYDILEGGEGYVGKIPGLQGVWANADTLEACRDKLREVLDEWIILGLKMNHRIPVIDGLELNLEKVA